MLRGFYTNQFYSMTLKNTPVLSRLTKVPCTHLAKKEKEKSLVLGQSQLRNMGSDNLKYHVLM